MKRRGNNLSKRSMAVVCIAVIALIGAAVLVTAAISPSGSKADPVVVRVNGEPVAEPEFRLYMDKEKGAVTNFFSVAYQAEDSKKYWTTEYGGETPLNRLKKQALDEARPYGARFCCRWRRREG